MDRLLPYLTETILNDDEKKLRSDTLAAARQAMRKKDPKTSVKLARKVLQIDPVDKDAHRILCRALFRLRKYKACRVGCRSALSLRNLGFGHRLGIGQLYEQCLLLQGILKTNDDDDATTPTEKLMGEWYKKRLEELLEQGDLSTEGIGGPNDCALVESGRTNFNGESAYHRERCGATRSDMNLEDFLRGVPLDQATGGVVYEKHRIIPFNCSKDTFPFPVKHVRNGESCYDGDGMCQGCLLREFPRPIYSFPLWPVDVNTDRQGVVESPNFELDVHYGKNLVAPQTMSTLRDELDRLPFTSPAPMYENRIDPNMNTREGKWVPTDFEISDHVTPHTDVVVILELVCIMKTGLPFPFGLAHQIALTAGASSLLGKAEMVSRISPDLDPHDSANLHLAIQQVLQDALPLLARLKRPSLLLPGPLQCVVKAQRIVLNNAHDEYEGIWHDDGLREHVVAVILFYYRKSPHIQGGNLELCTKRTHTVGKHDVNSGFKVEEYSKELPRSIIPVEEGSLIVFSNYSSVHRVLRMIRKPNESTGTAMASRDFLAFFVIDQRVPLQHHPRDLEPIRSFDDRTAYATELLQEQLQPTRTFGVDGSFLFSTGNGSLADIGWVASTGHGPDPLKLFELFEHEICVLTNFNAPPPLLDRGLSSQSEFKAIYNPLSSWTQYTIEEEDTSSSLSSDKSDSSAMLGAFVNWSTWEATTKVPTEGVRAFRCFSSQKLWTEFAEKEYLWWSDDEQTFR